jgi:subtilase family serine protease
MRPFGLRPQLFLSSTLVLTFALTAGAGYAQSVRTHHVHEAVRNGSAQVNGHLKADTVLQLDVVLPLRDAAGLNRFLADIYNPASANYHHYLTPTEFTAQFGPMQADYDAAAAYLTDNGLTVTGGSRDGMDIQASGTVAAIESAFRVQLLTYKHPTEGRTFYSPDTEPTTGLPFSLWHVSGLDNYSIPHPLVKNVNDFAAEHHLNANDAVAHATTGSGPSASYLGSDMRAAYYGGTALRGSGQNLGLFEFLGTNLADLNTYYKNVGQTNTVPVTLLSVDGTSTSCSRHCDDTEQNLDMTQALGMAPQLASLTMYVGSTDTALLSSMTTHNPLPTTIGCSWGWTPADPATLDPYFEKMAAQGQSFFAASGDYSTWAASGNAEAWPADDAYVISVGGTDLVTASAGGAWQSETSWADSGGGISPDKIALPWYQQDPSITNNPNGGSATLRNGPDVAANADFTFYTCANGKACNANLYGGTSFAAPMWAGFAALANQQLASGGHGPVGFLNPTIYAQNVTAAYAANFHDIASGTSGSYSAGTGFDLVTGWGSPTAALISALTSGTPVPPPASFTIAASPASVTVTRGSSVNTTISTSGANGFNSSVKLTASGMPSGVTVSFSPSTIPAPGTGSSTMNVAASRKSATGTYTISVTATGGGLTQKTSVTVTIGR